MAVLNPRWFAAGIFFSTVLAAQVPSDAEIRKILADRIGAENRGIGIVVGVIDANGRRIVGYGSQSRGGARVDGDTVYEIGSMSKVFTSLVLMDMTRRGEVALTDPVSKYLTADVKVPERNGRKITLADLSTQSSGLPRMPSNFHPKDSANPYADYSIEQMYEFISGYQLTRDIGSQYEYSNLGVGLLGHVLSLRAGMNYEALVRSRVCDPLELAHTRITLSPEMKAHLAIGHNGAGVEVANWDLPTFAGAGALRSTTNDMLTFLAANLGFVKTPLAQAMADEVSIRRPTGSPNMEIAYAWHVLTKDGSSIIWHNGGTGGYRTFMGYDPKARVGIVVLSNISTEEGTDDIGRHLLNASYPLAKVAPPAEHTETTLDAKILDRYVGTYKIAPYVLVTMSRDGDHLYTQITGQDKIELFPENERKFFLKVVDAQVTFDVDAQGSATQMTLHQGGRDQVAPKLSEADAKTAMSDIEAHAAFVAKRFKDQTPLPGGEEIARKELEQLGAGKPDYDRMSPSLAAATRTQLPQMQSTISGLGELKSVSFKGVGPGGMDIYEAKFEHGSAEYRFMLSSDGKIDGALFRLTQ